MNIPLNFALLFFHIFWDLKGQIFLRFWTMTSAAIRSISPRNWKHSAKALYYKFNYEWTSIYYLNISLNMTDFHTTIELIRGRLETSIIRDWWCTFNCTNANRCTVIVKKLSEEKYLILLIFETMKYYLLVHKMWQRNQTRMDTENSMDRSEFAASIDNNDGGDSNKGFLFLNK